RTLELGARRDGVREPERRHEEVGRADRVRRPQERGGEVVAAGGTIEIPRQLRDGPERVLARAIQVDGRGHCLTERREEAREARGSEARLDLLRAREG